MSVDEFNLATDLDTLLSLEIDAALAESDAHECFDYGTVFYARAKALEDSGNDEHENAWRLLGQLAQIDLRASDTATPFQALGATRDGRTLIPSDLDEATSEAVYRFSDRISDPELKARLCDVTWVRLRRVDAARDAISLYLEAAARLFDPSGWPPYVKRVERALRLAVQISDDDLLDTVLDEVENRVINLDGQDPLYMTSSLMALMNEFRRGDPAVMSEVAGKAATAAEAENDYERARSHWENQSRWRRLAKDGDGERDARIVIAQTYEKQADLHRGEGGEMQVAHWLEKAHEAYRNIPRMREKATEVYELLREAQEKSVSAMQEIKTDGINITVDRRGMLTP